MERLKTIEKGDALLELGRYEEAIVEYSKAINEQGYNSYVYQMISFSYFRLDNISQASNFANKALAEDPENDYAYYLKALIKRENGFAFDSKQFVEKAIAINPYEAFYFGLLSNVLFKMENYDEAIEQAKRGLELEEDEHECLMSLLFSYNNTEQEELFLETEKIALQFHPDSPNLHHNLSIIYSFRKDFEKAEEHSKIALQQNPDYEDTIQLHQMNKKKQPLSTKTNREIEEDVNWLKVFLWVVVLIIYLSSYCN